MATSLCEVWTIRAVGGHPEVTAIVDQKGCDARKKTPELTAKKLKLFLVN